MIRNGHHSLKQPRDRKGRFSAKYDAATETTRRRPHVSKLMSEDAHLPNKERKKIVGGARDSLRYFVLLGWMVRTYLNFVSGFSPKFTTGDRGFDRELKLWAEERSTAENFDVRGIHDRRRWMRLAEARRLLDGDIFALKLTTRHLQAIEGDRIQTPPAENIKGQEDQWTNGVKINRQGRPTAYGVHRRNGSKFEFERFLSARRIIPHCWWESTFRFDQSRGISPITCALNELADFYEAKTYAQAKLKVAQMLGLVIYSNAADAVGGEASIASEGSEDVEGDEKYEVDVHGGPWKLELDGDDRAEFLESGVPAADSLNFLNFCALVFMKALDIPYSYLREDFTNFFGSKIATTLMLQSSRPRRAEVEQFLCRWMSWQIDWATLPENNEIQIPVGMDIEHVKRSCGWVPDGMPWFDRSREVKPALTAIAGGIESLGNLVQQLHGMDLDDWLNKLQDEQELVNDSGVDLANWDKVEGLYDSEEDVLDADAV